MSTDNTSLAVFTSNKTSPAAWARQGYQAMDRQEMVDDVDQWLAGR